jgi:hemerythrin superfamily protein
VDAITLLKRDHANVKELFAQVDELGDRADASRKKLFRKIDTELTVHSRIEESIFYPAFKQRADESDEVQEVLEAYEEHALVKTLIGELEDLDPKDETYRPKLTVLNELVDHHVKEEEGTLFKMARQLFDKDELNELGDRLSAAKDRELVEV